MHYVGVEGNIGNIAIRIELDFEPGIHAITSSTAMNKDNIAQTPFKIKLTNTRTNKEEIFDNNSFKGNSQLNYQTSAKFKITKSRYDINEVNQAVVREFGSQYRVADWNDILKYKYKIKDFIQMIGGMQGEHKSLTVTKNGNLRYSSSRPYFITFHKHNKPSNYLAHDNIDRYYLSLGSWKGKRYVLCIKK